MSSRTDVIIIGAGQAGLAMSRCLTEMGIDHVLLERGQVGERWRSERWDSLRLLTPNWMTRLPHCPSHGQNPQGFMRSRHFVQFLEDYRLSFAAPVQSQTRIVSVTLQGNGYLVETDRGDWQARSVIIATGTCDRPFIPQMAGHLSEHIHQITPGQYRRANLLPVGKVLVVGASATGIQLAEEIHRSGRDVTIAVGRHVPVPRHYRGRDIMEWLDLCGFLRDLRKSDADPHAMIRQPSLQLIGNLEGRSIDLQLLQQQGVRIVGRATGASEDAMQFAMDIKAECRAARERRNRLLARIDAYVASNDINAPEEADARRAATPVARPVGTINLRQEGIRTIVWATGYRREYPWLKVPVVSSLGEIENHGGETPSPGLFTLGLPFMRHRASTFIDGVGRDAEYLATRIAAHVHQAAPRASFAALAALAA